MTLPPLPPPDTHCFDDDTGLDVWSHSPDQMRAYGEVCAAAERERKPLTEEQISNRAWAVLHGPVSTGRGNTPQAAGIRPPDRSRARHQGDTMTMPQVIGFSMLLLGIIGFGTKMAVEGEPMDVLALIGASVAAGYMGSLL